MNATAQSEMINAKARKVHVFGNQQPSACTCNVNHGMMAKVQRLFREEVRSSERKSGASMKRTIERFEEKVDKSGNCHIFTGRIQPNGYGQFRKGGKTMYAHRAAYELYKGDIGDKYVCHTCDNRSCVNPEHLFLGSFQDNMDDMTTKMRHAFGERNPHAKLDEGQVREIRTMTGTQEEIAAKFGVTRSLISLIKSGKIWKHA